MQISEAIALLGHYDQGIREQGMTALRQHGQAAVPALCAALDHPEATVRGNAALLLGELGAQEALPALLNKVAELAPGDDRTFCVRALADLCGPHLREEPGVLEAFARLSGDPDLFVRALACTALGRLGNPKAVPFLARARGDKEPWVRDAAAKAFEELARAPQPGKLREPQAAKPAAPAVESDAPAESPPEVPVVASAPEPDAAEVDESPTAEHLHQLLTDLFSDDAVKRDLAAEELVAIGPPAVQPLCSAIRSPVRDPPLQALLALGRLHDRAALGPLLSVAANPGSDAELRTVAIRAIGQICDGGEKAVLELLLADKPEDPLLRAAVAFALGAFRSVRSVRALLAYLDDPNEFVRESAVGALGRAACAGVPDLAPRLTEMLRRERDGRVRALAAEALEAAVRAGAVPAETAAAAGAELLSSSGADAKLSGLHLLGAAARGNPDASRALVAALRDPSKPIRLLACERVGEVVPSGYAPAVEVLTRLASDPDRDVSRAAILALGAVGGPEAAVTLRHLRGDGDPDVADAARAAIERLPPEGAEVIPLRPER